MLANKMPSSSYESNRGRLMSSDSAKEAADEAKQPTMVDRLSRGITRAGVDVGDELDDCSDDPVAMRAKIERKRSWPMGVSSRV